MRIVNAASLPLTNPLPGEDGDAPPPTSVTAIRSKPRSSKRPNRPETKTFYLVIWWMSHSPYAALFENRIAAEAAANVRNALLVTVRGGGTEIEEIVDWYRRDPEGQPMPVEWRDLAGQIRVHWSVKIPASPEAAEIA